MSSGARPIGGLDPREDSVPSVIASAALAARGDPPPAAPADGGSVRTRGHSSVYVLGDGAIDSTLQTLSLAHLKGADHAEELRRELDGWHRAFTSRGPKARFALDSRIGEGAQGVIFGVLDRDCRRIVALKTLHSAGVDPTEVSRFIHEAQITAQLEHPGIVPVHDFGTLPDGTVFYTMKRIEGESLAGYMQDRAAKAAQRFDLLQLFLRVCETMAFAHSRGVVHRDLKPRNIMVGAYGEVLVMDWGLAKIVAGGDAPPAADGTSTERRVTSLRVDAGGSDTDIHRTLDGFAVGTPAYMSPEQARGEADRVDGRSDIYSLGVILFEMLAGRSPYERGDVRQTLEQVAAGRWLRLDQLDVAETIDRSLRAIVHKAMAFRREERYADVAALAGDIRGFLAGQAVSAHRESWIEQALRLYRRNRITVLATASIAALALIAFSAAWIHAELKRSSAIAAHRTAAAAAIARGGADDLEEATRRLRLLLELAPDDRHARDALVEARELTRAGREREAQAEMRVSRERDARALLAEAEALATKDAPEPLDAAAKRVLQAIGLVQSDGEADALRAQLDARYEALLTRKVQLEEAERLERERVAQAAAAQRRRADADAQLAALAEAVRAGDLAAAAQRLGEARAIDPAHPKLDEAARSIDAADAERRRRTCQAKLGEARAAQADVASAAASRDALARDVDALAKRLQQGEVGVRGELAAAERRLDDAARARDQALTRVYDLLHDADRAVPGEPDVCRALVDFFEARAAEAEAEGNGAGAASQLAQARAWAASGGLGEPAGATRVAVPAQAPSIALRALATDDQRLDVPTGEPRRVEPGESAEFAAGRYLAETAAGVRAAVRLERGHVLAIALPPAPKLPADTAWIPGGRIWDERHRAIVGRDGAEVVVEPFAMALRETTCAEYLEFLNAPATLKLYEAAWRRGVLRLCPRSGLRDEPLWRKNGVPGSATGQFQLVANDRDAKAIDPALPVSGISSEDAQAYAQWRAQRDGVAWRLPTRWEWQLAAQGGDGRAYPWGDRADPTCCYSLVAAAADGASGAALTVQRRGGSFPADRSVQGVFDLAGSLSEFVVDPDAQSGWAAVMGGNLGTRDTDRFTTWNRRWVDPRVADLANGIRLVATIR